MLLTAIFIGICFLSGCRKEPPDVWEGPDPADMLIGNVTLKQADLHVAWSSAMPLQPRERLAQLRMLEDKIYMLSSNNYLVSIDRLDAEPAFGYKLADPSYTVGELQSYKGKLYGIVGTNLDVINPVDGSRVKSVRLGYGTVCTPARNNTFYYVAGTDERIHAIRSDNYLQLFEGSARDNSQITTVIADDQRVIFATQAGNVIAMATDKAKKIWDFSAQGAINHPLVKDSVNVAFSSRDTNVYMLNLGNGALKWKYLTSALLRTAPVVTDRFVYQALEGKGLIVINKADGKLAWKLDDGLALLAEDGNKIYLMAKGGKLVVMDLNKKKVVKSIDMPQVTNWITNTVDNRIYLADEFGRIVCVEPLQY